MKDLKCIFYVFENVVALLLFIAAQPISCSGDCSCYRKFEQKPNVLDCSNTGITNLSDLLVPNETSWLVAKNNKIDHLQFSSNLNQMEHINLANSSICSIGQNFFSKLATSGEVRYLNLADNKLKHFNRDIQGSNLSEIYLSGNPIDCNCDMFWFVKWLNTTVVKDSQDITCVGGEWDGTQVYELTREQMRCIPAVLEL